MRGQLAANGCSVSTRIGGLPVAVEKRETNTCGDAVDALEVHEAAGPVFGHRDAAEADDFLAGAVDRDRRKDHGARRPACEQNATGAESSTRAASACHDVLCDRACANPAIASAQDSELFMRSRRQVEGAAEVLGLR